MENLKFKLEMELPNFSSFPDKKFQFPLLVYHPLSLDFQPHIISAIPQFHLRFYRPLQQWTSIHKRLIAISTVAITFYHHHIGFYTLHPQSHRISISAMIRDHFLIQN